jgi:hypothetical protein
VRRFSRCPESVFPYAQPSDRRLFSFYFSSCLFFCSFPYYATCFFAVLLFGCFALLVFIFTLFSYFSVFRLVVSTSILGRCTLFAICNPNWSVATVCCKLTTEHNGGLCVTCCRSVAVARNACCNLHIACFNVRKHCILRVITLGNIVNCML